MDLMEYQARVLLEGAGVPVPYGVTLDTPDAFPEDALRYPVAVKAQVLTGGRGKAGGIRFAKNEAEARASACAMLGMEIKGHRVDRVMVAEKVNVAHELYLSIVLDRYSKCHTILFSPEGGMDIEETARVRPDRIARLAVDPLLGLCVSAGKYLGGKAGLNQAQKRQLQAILEKIYVLARERDAMLIEINPLAVTDQGVLVACDAKITVDDSALYRQDEIRAIRTLPGVLEAEAEAHGFLYIPCESGGRIVVASNGSGMLMSTIDHIERRGMSVAAVLDLGGGATAARIEQAVRILFRTPDAELMFINIFGGITRCDEVAAGIRAAVEKQCVDRPIVARFEGTRKHEGLDILAGLPYVRYVDNLAEGVEALYEHLGR